MRTTIVICEGPHDTAFISRIMKANGYSQYNNAIKDYPKYLSEFIISHIVANNVDGLNLQEARSGRIVPYNTLTKDDNLIILFSIGGDSRQERRKYISRAFKELFEQEISKREIKNQSLRIIFEMDADQEGILLREKTLIDELSDSFGSPNGLELFGHKKWVSKYGIEWGTYIFHKPGEESCGKLEDMIIPIFVAENEDISEDIDFVLNKRSNYKLFISKKAVKHDKAKIGMMGQLEKEGSASPAIIEQSSYITDDKIKRDKICMEIADYIGK